MKENNEVRKPFYKDLNIWFGVIGVTAFIFSLYSYFFPGEPNLKFYMLDNTSILDVKEEVTKLNITYDSINLLKSEMDISIMLMQIKNEGDKNITVSDYDQNIPFGLKLKYGIILNKPELISSSENEYYNDIVSRYNNEEVFFKYKLIDKDKFINIKLLVLHKKNVLPVITIDGKISGIDKLELTNIAKSKDETIRDKPIIYIIIGSLLFIVMLLIIIMQRQSINKANHRVERLLMGLNQLKTHIKQKSILELETPQVNSDNDDLSFEEKMKLKKDDFVLHSRFGRGKVIDLILSDKIEDSRINILFDEVGTKILLIRFAPLKKILDFNV